MNPIQSLMKKAIMHSQIQATMNPNTAVNKKNILEEKNNTQAKSSKKTEQVKIKASSPLKLNRIIKLNNRMNKAMEKLMVKTKKFYKIQNSLLRI